MTLAAALAAFDDGALRLLSNKGTVRRAVRDVEEGKVTLIEADGDRAVVAADGETVRIDSAGPAKASCTCPAPGVCRHRIAAVLLLQAGVAPAEAEDLRAALLAEVAAIPGEALRRFAGRAGWRAALELAEAGGEVDVDGTALRIRLAGDEEVHYLRGLGLDGMVSKLAPGKRKAYHAAALVAARRMAGVEPERPSAAEAEEADTAPDPAFLAEVRNALAEACRSALSLAPLALEERLSTLSVSSRADTLPRLSALLRAIARMVRERRTRDVRFDPDHCLGRIAAADALARALAAAGDPGRRAALAGSIRQDYADCGPLRLRGVGAETWRSEGGARGVSAWFYDADGDRWFTAALVRGAGQDPSFDPRRAYAQEAVWGNRSLADLARAEVAFGSVMASRGGRLSTASGTCPDVAPAHGLIPEQWQCAFADWRALETRLRDRLAGSLAAAPPAVEPVVLHPRRLGRPFFDELSQMLYCPVEDRNGRWVAVSVAHDPSRAPQADALVDWLVGERVTALVIGAESAGARFRLRPLAIEAGGVLMSIGFDLAEAKRPGFLQAGLRGLLQRRTVSFGPTRATMTVRLLGEVGDALVGLAETGCRLVSSDSDRRLAALAARAGRLGLSCTETAIERVRRSDTVMLAPAVLAGRYVVDVLLRQLAVVPWLLPS
jgi:hypothetical protein